MAESYRNCKQSSLRAMSCGKSWKERFALNLIVEMLEIKKKKKTKFLVLVFSFMVCLLLQVNYLQNDNALLENKQKELKGTIQILLQSKESFVNAYEVCNL